LASNASIGDRQERPCVASASVAPALFRGARRWQGTGGANAHSV